jgi:5-methyltetrahydrofolate--homocysteine methyltransferase
METILQSKTKTVIISPEQPFVMIGERINPTGRKKLGIEMAAGDFSRVRRDAESQIAAGAQVLDVNAGVPGADEPALLVQAIKTITEVVDVPLCLDSSIIAALEAGLAVYQGKALVNSITGEDERLEILLPVIKKYNAAVIGMANDETGISPDPEVRLSVARKIVQRAADHGIAANEVLIDPLTLAIATDSQATKTTLETMRLIQRELGVNMVCGASNVSFGLPDRSPINAAFISMAMQSGLTSAITDPTNAVIRQAILATDLLLGKDNYAMNWIADFRKRIPQT